MGTKKSPKENLPNQTTRARASGIPAGGVGWGGPAKGPGTGKAPILNRPLAGPGRGHINEERAAQAARDIAEAMALYRTVMRKKTEATPNRLAAATHLLNRVQGQPIAKMEHAIDVFQDDDPEFQYRLSAWRESILAGDLPPGPHGLGNRSLGPGAPEAGAASPATPEGPDGGSGRDDRPADDPVPPG